MPSKNSKPMKKTAKPAAKKAAKPAPAKKAAAKPARKPAVKTASKPAAKAAKPAPAPAPAPVQEKAPEKPVTNPVKTTSELQARLAGLGISAHLASPPRLFVAVLSNEKTGETVSDIFGITSHGESSSQKVLTKLVSRMLGTQISRAEHATCSLEFFIESEMDGKGQDNVVIPGTNVRFRRRAAQENWENLGENVRVQLFRNNPHVLDADADTLATNKRIAAEAIEATKVEMAKESASLAIGILRVAARRAAVQSLEGDL